jgi:hypothetical protein
MALVVVLLIASIALARLARAQDRTLARFAAAGLAMHLVFAFVQEWVHASYYAGVSDVYHFAEIGTMLSRAMSANSSVIVEVVKMALHLEAQLPFGWLDAGSSTSTTEALTGLLFYVFGESLLISFLAVSVFVWFTQVALARTFADLVGPDERPLVYASIFLVPSVVFWSSGITKEAFVLAGVFLLSSGVHAVLSRRAFGHVATAAVGALLVGLIKPYTLFPFMVAIGVWVFISRAKSAHGTIRIRVMPLVAAGVIAFGGVLVMGQIFPEFSLSKIGESAARQQESWMDDSGSSVEIGSTSSTVTSQLPFIPLALVNSLFRPLIFESRSLTAFGASVETTALIIIVALIAFRFRFKALRDAILSSPLVAASLTFTLLFGMAVGLVTRNLGSLSRYRMPMIPFYVLAVALLLHRLRRKAVVAAPQPQPLLRKAR